MSTVTLPPIGAKIRVTRVWADGTSAVIEGVVSGHPAKYQTTDFVNLGGSRLVAFLDDRDGATVAVEVLEPPLPPEPEDGTVVTNGKKVFLRQVTATHGAEQSWWRTADDEPWTWKQVCSTGELVRLVPDPAADAESSHGIYTQPGHGTEFCRVGVEGGMVVFEGRGRMAVAPSSAASFGASVLAAAREAGQP